MFKYFFFLLSIAALNVFASDLANHSEWHKLLRYEKTLFGHKSEIDAKEYFLAEEGKTNPQKELEATIEGLNRSLKEDEDINAHPICVFPARLMWLLEKGVELSPKVNLIDCTEFQTYLKRINLESVSLVFSSYYIENPSSAFGHTFLKIKTKDSGIAGNDLLDYAVNFAANTTTDNPIMYGVMGIIGGFRANYALMPYFFKIREYNDIESRSLWDYEINFTNREKAFFALHLWEMNGVWMDYFYFTENCSYHILRLIDAVAPRFNLIKNTPYIVVPVDTVKALTNEPDAVKKVSTRASSLDKALWRLEKLELREQKEVVVASKELKLAGFPGNNSEFYLDALIDLIDYTYPNQILFGIGENAEKIKAFKEEVLILRSRQKINSEKYDNKKSDPAFSHESKRISFASGKVDQDDFYSLKLRMALHDILQVSYGNDPLTTLEMGKLSLSKKYNQGILLDELSIVRVMTMRPVSLISKKMSWDFDLGFNRPLHFNEEIGGVGTRISLGATLEISNNFYTFLYVKNSLFYSASLEDKEFRYQAGPGLTLFYPISEKIKILTGLNYLKDLTIANYEYAEEEYAIQWNINSDFSLAIKYQKAIYEKAFGEIAFSF